MEVIKPTPTKFPKPLREALEAFAEEKEGGNISRVVRKAVAQYISFNSEEMLADVTSLPQSVILSGCKDAGCSWCNGTGEIRVEAPTVGKAYYYTCYGEDGSIGGMPNREEPLSCSALNTNR